MSVVVFGGGSDGGGVSTVKSVPYSKLTYSAP